LTTSDSTLSGNTNTGVGGAIDNAGTLTVSSDTLSGNSDVGVADGAIYNGGALTISNSTLSDNAAVGGVYSDGDSPYPLQTIGGNAFGVGLYIAGGAVSLDHSTLAGNQVIGGSGNSVGNGYGGGIDNAAGQSALRVYDTIVADNNAIFYFDSPGYDPAGFYDPADYSPDLGDSFTSLGHNLVGNSTAGSGSAATDLLNVEARLGPLQDNGGPTQAMALLPGSPAINAGDNTGAPAYDQRGSGFPRIVGGAIDIGAFEVQNGSPTQAGSLAVAGFPSTTAGVAGTFTVTALKADGSSDTSCTGTIAFTSSDGQAGLPADYTFTAADAGVHTFSATLKTAGTQSLTATDATTAGLTGTDRGITVTAAAASRFVIRAPSSVSAGVPFSLTLTVEDACGNVVTGYTGTVHFSSTDTRATLPSNYTFTAADKGVHPFTGLVLRKKGQQTVAITDAHNSSLTGGALVDVL
jgi:hypothetical protein